MRMVAGIREGRRNAFGSSAATSTPSAVCVSMARGFAASCRRGTGTAINALASPESHSACIAAATAGSAAAMPRAIARPVRIPRQGMERVPGRPIKCRDGRRHPLQLAIIALPLFIHLRRDEVIFATISACVRHFRSSPKSSSAGRPASDQPGSVLGQWRHIRPRQPHHKPRGNELHPIASGTRYARRRPCRCCRRPGDGCADGRLAGVDVSQRTLGQRLHAARARRG